MPCRLLNSARFCAILVLVIVIILAFDLEHSILYLTI
jgi:hypothetical protein